MTDALVVAEVAPAPPPARRSAPVLAVIAALVATVVALWPVVADRRPPSAAADLPWWLLLAMFGLAEVFVLHVQLRREAKTISLSEIPLVLAMFFVGAPMLILTRVVGCTLAFVLHRRQRNPL